AEAGAARVAAAADLAPPALAVRADPRLEVMSELRPISTPERVAVLDVLRGFALFGVLIVNVEGAFSTGWFRPDPATTLVHVAANWFVRIFVAGKSITLLTFLFGLGFAVQL